MRLDAAAALVLMEAERAVLGGRFVLDPSASEGATVCSGSTHLTTYSRHRRWQD